MKSKILFLLIWLVSVAGYSQIQQINVGTTANDNEGDKPRTAFIKAKYNFNYLDTRLDSLIEVGFPTLTASSGITKSGNDFQLGGTLTSNVSIGGNVDGAGFAMDFSNTAATRTGFFAIGGNSYINPNNTGSVELLSLDNSFSSSVANINLSGFSGKFGVSEADQSSTHHVYLEALADVSNVGTLRVVDNRAVKKGLQAAASGYVTDPLSYATKEYVDATAGGGGWATTGTTALTGNTTIDINEEAFSFVWDDLALNAGEFSVTPFVNSMWRSYNPGSTEYTTIEQQSAGGGVGIVSSGPPGVSNFNFSYGGLTVLTPSSSTIQIGLDYNVNPTTYAGINIDGPSNNVTINATDVGVSNSFIVSSAGIFATDSNGGAVEVGGGDVAISGNSGATTLTINNLGFEFLGGNIDMPNGSATLNFPSTAAQSSSDLTIAYTGAAVGDMVVLGVPQTAIVTNSCYTAWVSSANTITVRFNNYAAGPGADPGSGTFKVTVIK